MNAWKVFLLFVDHKCTFIMLNMYEQARHTLTAESMAMVGFGINASCVSHISASVPCTILSEISFLVRAMEASVATIGMAS